MYLEGADAVHLVAEEVDAVGQLAGEGLDVDDAAAHGELTGLIDVVGALEAEGKQRLLDKHDIDALPHPERQSLFAECLLGDNQFAEGLRVGETLGWKKHKLESRLPGEISITSDMWMTPPLWQKVKKN